MPMKGNFVKQPRNKGREAPERKRDSTRKDRQSDGGSAKRGHSRDGDSATKGGGQKIGNLGGFIFKCSGTTKMDCFKYRVFGLNEGKRKLVEQVRRGMRLFLFDVDLRLLYGIYTAVSAGSYKLEPDAFKGQFPWQVRFSIQKDCLPLSEDIFKAAVRENYMDQSKLKVELTSDQVHRLLKLFRPIPGAPRRRPRWSRAPAQNQLDVLPRFLGSDLFKNSQISLKMADEPLHVPADRHMNEKEGYDKSRTKYADVYHYEEWGIPDGNSSRLPRFDHKRVPELDQLGVSRRFTGSDPRRHSQLSSSGLYEHSYIPADRSMSEKEGYDKSRTKYADFYRSEEHLIPDGTSSRVPRLDHKSLYDADDVYIGRESRADREIGFNSGLSRHNFPPYSNDPVRPLSEIHMQHEREELLSRYPTGRTLGNPGGEVNSLYHHSTDLRGHVLDRRLAAVDPLVDGYLDGLSSDILHERVSLNDLYGTRHDGLSRNASLLPGGISGASGFSSRSELLPDSRFYGL